MILINLRQHKDVNWRQVNKIIIINIISKINNIIIIILIIHFIILNQLIIILTIIVRVKNISIIIKK